MKSRGLQQVLIVVSIGAMLAVAVAGFLSVSTEEEGNWLQPGEVKGASVWVYGLEYPLNFDQQVTLLRFLNGCEKTQFGNKGSGDQLLPVERVTLYTFTSGELELMPGITAEGRALLASPHILLVENEVGSLKQVLHNSYPH